jgi:hypothetical protein
MANLRVIDVNAADSRTIKAKFTDSLSTSISANNITVEGVAPSTPDAKVLSVFIRKDILIINVRPLTPFVKYNVTFKSTKNIPFTNQAGNSYILEDGRTNVVEIIGAEDPNNIIRDNLVSYLKDNIYNLDQGTLVRTILNQLSGALAKILYDTRQAKNENYLSVLINNERKVRGFGPWDRLAEESSYEVARVGITEQNANLDGILNYASFPYNKISLQSTTVATETLHAGSSTSTFNALILTVAKSPVIKVNSLVIRYQLGGTYTYNIRTYGYQLNDPSYDPDYASTLLTLGVNQIQLSSDVLDDPTFKQPGSGDTVTISYDYKHLGKVVDETSVNVIKYVNVVREPAPPLITAFSLAHAPVVTASGAAPITGGVQFLDPASATPFLTTHLAFLHEIPFNYASLPKNPGEFSVDYATGRVFVYGATTNDGTGNFPPAMNYNYEYTFRDSLDYTYEPDGMDLVASPLRDLSTQTASIVFKYEVVLLPGTDYLADTHLEALNERIQNRLTSTGSLQTLNGPITDVFRVFNETIGEIYTVSRFSDAAVYFNYNVPPNIQDATRERATFADVLNELMIVESEQTNIHGVRVFTIRLANSYIMSVTEDVVGTSFNNSTVFSRADVFENEIYYDDFLTAAYNIDKLLVGKYAVNYKAGIVYVGVLAGQSLDIGTVSYKEAVVSPQNSHIISVSDIYYSLNISLGVTKQLDYSSFGEGEIIPNEYDYANERFLNGDVAYPYTVGVGGTIQVTDDVKTVRHVFDVYDLDNSLVPTDFGEGATAQGNVITLDPDGVEKTSLGVVAIGLTVTVPTISAGIEIGQALNVTRISDGYEFLDGNETISGNTIILSGTCGATPGDAVHIIYTVILNTGATPVVDYDRGGYYIDYTYLKDEILVSYEYGDNVIDFRESDALDENDEYFVTYKVGALRNALLYNFGSLIDIPELNVEDVDLSREVYRDALTGALQSFLKGPTIPSIKQIVSSITKISPEIEEAAFNVWSLGNSRLQPQPIYINGNPQFVAGKFDQGAEFNLAGDSLTFPVSSNLRLEEGTLEMWFTPHWDGLDNDATLTFSNLIRDGYVIPDAEIFIGSSSFNPVSVNNSFTVNRIDSPSPIGLPSAIYTVNHGLFIYYDDDFKRWKVIAKDQSVLPPDGYVYSGNVTSSGAVYDVQFIPGMSSIDDSLRSGSSQIDFLLVINSLDGYVDGYALNGAQFMADDEHYLFDFADDETRNRFSIYKDGRGYLSFSVWDQGGGFNEKPGRCTNYMVSADIQNWTAGIPHHIATSWILNSSDRKDEMHLYIDGLEVPNIIKYGGIPPAVSADRFRTVATEYVAGTVPKVTIAGNDLNVSSGSITVSSASVDFQARGVLPGDTIEILEIGFSTYTILTVVGPVLTLSAPMPASLPDARFSVNPYSVVVQSEINFCNNIAVSVYDGYKYTEIPGVRATIPGYAITRNVFNQDELELLGDAEDGYSIVIRTLGLNHRRCLDRAYLWDGYQSILKTALPPPIDLDATSIRAMLLPYVSIGPSNSVIWAGGFLATLSTSQPTNQTEGRHLEVRVTGGNVDFGASPTIIVINGVSTGPGIEVLFFNTPGIQYTTDKWMTITSVICFTTPISLLTDGVAIEIKEQYSVAYSDGNTSYPVIRYAYQTQSGITLSGGGGSDIVTDLNGFFPASTVGNLLEITYPPAVVGTYEVIEKIDNYTIRLNAAIGPVFTNGRYATFNISIGRSGFQNGFFFLQLAGFTNIPYPLPQGYYEFDYAAYLEIPFSPIDQIAYVGSNYTDSKPARGIIDELRILSKQLTDTRVGETIGANDDSITVDYGAIRPFRKNINTLMLMHFDTSIPTNDSDYYTYATRSYLQSGESVNSKFGQSIVIKNNGLVFDNQNRVTTRNEGTISFWASPRYDTYNDPVPRVYFDATSAVVESVTSLTKKTVKVSGRIGQVISVRLVTDNGTGTNYYSGGSVASDFRTIQLKQALPYQQMPVKVSYIPSGLQGDRLTILKDDSGYIAFNVHASGMDYQVRQPVFWPRDTWHRIRASWKFNTANNQDEIRLFVDGEERGVVLFGQGLLFGQGVVFGQSTVGVTNQILVANIDFIDPIMQFTVGMDYTGSFGAQARMDNLKLSDKSIPPITIAGQPMDVYYNTNPDVIYPEIEDAFTTFLMNFDSLVEKTDDFAILRDPTYGLFNFTLNIIDSFRIVVGDARIQQLLESMINALKPAHSKVEINYIV